MKSLSDYQDPFAAIREFEQALCTYTGAPYAVVTDCCTHAIEIALLIKPPDGIVRFPKRTYLSVPMTMHKLHISYHLVDRDWRQDRCYQFENTNVWDCARLFEKNMYQAGQIQCLSFGLTKPLQIGLGGCLLTDDPEVAKRAHRMRYDGRDFFSYTPWNTQPIFEVGFHYYLRPEECISGLNLLYQNKITPQLPKYFDYPDCQKIKIVDAEHTVSG